MKKQKLSQILMDIILLLNFGKRKKTKKKFAHYLYQVNFHSQLKEKVVFLCQKRNIHVTLEEINNTFHNMIYV